jgi:hypothetical protein
MVAGFKGFRCHIAPIINWVGEKINYYDLFPAGIITYLRPMNTPTTPTPPTPAALRKLLKGKTLLQAENILHEYKYFVYVIKDDDKNYAITDDVNPHRVQVTLEKGIVVSSSIG